MKKIGMIVLFSLFLLAMPVPAWGASTELASYLEDLDMEQIDAAAENAVEDVTFSELVEDVLIGDFSFSMEDLWEKLGKVAFGEFTSWLKSHNYSVKELELALLNGRSNNSVIEKWLRWAVVCASPLFLPAGTVQTLTGIGLSFLEQLLPQFSGQKIPVLYFDKVLSKQFDSSKMNRKLQSKFGF